MALHDSLRELVSVRGAAVVEDADELRGALDDFLAEDEATLGELNLLVDAVRLGALRRVLDVMAHGAEPQAAVREAGAALARDRGTDDPTRSCWALAALGFALGKVDEPMVRMFRSDAGTMPAATPPAAPNGPAPVAAPVPAEPEPEPIVAASVVPPPPPPPTTAIGVPAATQPEPAQQAAQLPAQPYGTAPVPPVIPEERSSRAGTVLLVLLVALIVGGLIAAGVILLQDDDKTDDPTTSDSPTGPTDRPSKSKGPKDKPALITDDEMVVPYVVDDVSTVYKVNVFDGTFQGLTPEGVDARGPSISPDRRTITFQDFTDVPDGQNTGVLTMLDLTNSSYEPVFKDFPECQYSARAGWSLDGKRIAVVCTGDDDVPDGIYVANADGSDPRLVFEGSQLRGSPTWISPSEFVFASYEFQDGPVQLQVLDADNGGDPVTVPTADDGQISHADWSPAARKLLFLVSEPGSTKERGDVWTMNATGTDRHELADGNYSHPVWNVDGTKIGITFIDDSGTEVLGYLDADDSDAPNLTPHVVPNPPPGEVAIPVWASR
ncbi:hypothetical protein [Nocardioides humilatus]|uniref:hypothetical protein n=1 Tax=Nocardioides humilatus TaxID=2607660 RepID=UPI00165FA2A4|nr:hypothetical protein [Nocardioides humilatus]